MIISQSLAGRTAIVVFVDNTECLWLGYLKPGFRHCFVAVQQGSRWLICDSLKGHMELALVDAQSPVDLAQCYANQGHHVLIGRIGPAARRPCLSVTPLTCVTVTKRLLAVHAAWVWTPWQLFRHLIRACSEGWQIFSRSEPPRMPGSRLTLELDREML